MSVYKNLKKNRKDFKEFTRFLKEKKAYSSYFLELKRNNSINSSFVSEYEKNYRAFFEKCLPNLWLQHCFIWCQTKIGRTFWENLDTDWKHYYKQLYEI